MTEESKHPAEHLPLDKMHMLSQPLTTEDGYVNEACLNELHSVINNMPDTYDRLAGDPEWSLKFCTSYRAILAELAHWIIKGSGGVPDSLQAVLGYADAVLRKSYEWEQLGTDFVYQDLSLCDVNRMLHESFENDPLFEELNSEEFMKPQGLEWIDLHALFRNVCVGIRNDRRHDMTFEIKFAEDHPDSEICSAAAKRMIENQ